VLMLTHVKSKLLWNKGGTGRQTRAPLLVHVRAKISRVDYLWSHKLPLHFKLAGEFLVVVRALSCMTALTNYMLL